MFRTLTSAALIGTVGAMLLHYLLVGMRRARADSSGGNVHRYGVVERLVHAGGLLAFLTAATTGFGPVLVYGNHPAGWMKLVHAGGGGVLGVCVVVMGLLWALDATFVRVDWPWIKALGSHLSHTPPPPAERFDAGQKIFFWATIALALATLLSGIMRISYGFSPEIQQLALIAHRYTALLFVLCIGIHTYVMMFAKPGALSAMITGRVRSTWAKRYHSLWCERIK